MYPSTTLQPGAQGDSVKQLQSYLVSNGYLTQAEMDTGPGIYGPKTTAAVAKLQTAKGVDNSSGVGYFGPKTIAALMGNTTTPTTPTQVPTAPSTINSGNVSPVTPIPYSTPNPVVTYPVGSLDTSIPTPAAPATPYETKANDLTTQLQKLNDSLVGKSAFQVEQNTAAGVDTANQAITDLSSKLTGLQNEAKAIPIALQSDAAGRGITAGGLQPIQTEKLRNNAIEALTVSTLLDATKGNLVTAQAKADAAVAAKYGPVQEQIDAATKNLQLILNSPEYTLEEKNRAQTQLDIQNARQAQLDKEKSNTTAVQNVAIASAQYSKNFTPTDQYTTVASALTAISKATDPVVAQQIATSTGLVKPVDVQSQTINVGTSTAPHYVMVDSNTGKTIRDFGSTNPAGGSGATATGYNGEFAATVSLAASANKNASAATRAAVTKSLQTSIANGDYASAYQTIIQQTKANLTSTNATKFENATILGTTLNNLQTALQSYSAAGGDTNVFTGTQDQIQTKIGALLTDPRYASIAVQLDTAYQQYRQMLTGANFSAAEAAAYASVLPSKSNTLALNLSKIEGAKAAADSTIEGSIRQVVGEGGVYIKQYAENPGVTNSTHNGVTLPGAASSYQGVTLPH